MCGKTKFVENTSMLKRKAEQRHQRYHRASARFGGSKLNRLSRAARVVAITVKTVMKTIEKTYDNCDNRDNFFT